MQKCFTPDAIIEHLRNYGPGPFKRGANRAQKKPLPHIALKIASTLINGDQQQDARAVPGTCLQKPMGAYLPGGPRRKLPGKIFSACALDAILNVSNWVVGWEGGGAFFFWKLFTSEMRARDSNTCSIVPVHISDHDFAKIQNHLY